MTHLGSPCSLFPNSHHSQRIPPLHEWYTDFHCAGVCVGVSFVASSLAPPGPSLSSHCVRVNLDEDSTRSFLGTAYGKLPSHVYIPRQLLIITHFGLLPTPPQLFVTHFVMDSLLATLMRLVLIDYREWRQRGSEGTDTQTPVDPSADWLKGTRSSTALGDGSGNGRRDTTHHNPNPVSRSTSQDGLGLVYNMCEDHTSNGNSRSNGSSYFFQGRESGGGEGGGGGERGPQKVSLAEDILSKGSLGRVDVQSV